VVSYLIQGIDMQVTIRTKRGAVVNKLVCESAEFLIGKDAESLVCLNGWKVSGRHASVAKQQSHIFVRDLDSRTGTYIDGARISSYGPLKPGQQIGVGDYVIEISDPAIGDLQAELMAPSLDTPIAQKAAAIAALAETNQSMNATSTPDAVTPEFDPALVALEREWKRKVHKQVVDAIDLRRINISELDDDALRQLTTTMINDVLTKAAEFPDGRLDRSRIGKQVLEEAVGLGPLEDLLAQSDISEVMVNAYDEVYYEQGGRITKSSVTFTDNRAVMAAIERIVAPLGRRIDESSPMVDARLKDGSRVNAIIPPLAIKGPCITIRKFMAEKLTAMHLESFGSVSPKMVKFLELAVDNKLNILISGGTGSGKTTLLNVLSNFIPQDERIVTIEDAAELKLNQPHIVSLEARPPNQEGKGAVAIRDLVKNSLRMRPDRIVVGECRGGEALDMLQAMNTGHDGSLTTVHSNSPRDCISRLEVLVLMSGMDLPVNAIREQIASAIHLIVQQTRFACGSRKVTSICEVSGLESGVVQLAEIFTFKQIGYDEKGRVKGQFVATGIIPEFCEKMRDRGIGVDLSMFDRPKASAFD
jgi:pilus assembly protein CpaF